MIQRNIRYQTMFLIWATLFLLLPQQCFSGTKRLISFELALINVLRHCESDCFSKYHERLKTLGEELNKLVRLSVNGKLYPPPFVDVCSRLGSCSENSRKEPEGGPLCCTMMGPDDTIHVPEVTPAKWVVHLKKGDEIEEFSDPSLGTPRFFLVTQHRNPPNARPVKLSSDGKLLLKSIPRRHVVLFAIVKGEGTKLFKKLFWTLAPMKKP